MAFIGNTNTTQAFTPAVDFFSGNASTTAFTLSRPVASVAQVEVYVSNVPQTPSTAYTVSSNTITFTSAPPSGTNNIYVYYTSPITQVIAPGQGTVTSSSFGTITDFTTTGNTTLGDATTDTLTVGVTGIVKDASGNVGIGTSLPGSILDVQSATSIIRNTATTGTNQVAIRQGNTGGYFYTGIDTSTGGYLTGAAYAGFHWMSGAYPMIFATNNSERMRINSSGNVGIGTDTANATGTVRQLTVSNAGTPEFVLRDTSQAVDSRNWRIFNASNTLYIGTLNDAGTSGTDVAKFTSAGLFQFNSGYGSVATAYGCRAWVNFNGTGTVAIRASGNVSSITDNGTGDYTINFTTAMSDANYGVTGSAGLAASPGGRIFEVKNSTAPTTSSVRVLTTNVATTPSDYDFVSASIFR